MKELSIEQKAKRYDEAIEIAKEINNEQRAQPFNVMTRVFPELKESEDDKVRKKLIHLVKKSHEQGGYALHKWESDEMLAWLEKQGEQKPAFEMKTPEESLGIDSDTYNKIVDECIYGEQKSTDKVEPKFKVGDKVISILTNNLYYITEVCNGYYLTDVGCVIMFNAQDNFELSNKNPAWSEEDEDIVKDTIYFLDTAKKHYASTVALDACIDWFKSLKDRIQPQTTWKPSEEQMKALDDVISSKDIKYDVLSELYKDLKKLREE